MSKIRKKYMRSLIARIIVFIIGLYMYIDGQKFEILEEVLYTISLSIYDNYPVKEVIFMVNDEKITKTTSKLLE